uniref:Immunoglobulin V-set domain-containing protein n=1 Tax=Esox lucius TaxID=8010 RepID=A0A3P8YDD5_ESOLU
VIVIGVVGGRVIIKCSYTLAETSIKYFCKGICLTESGILIQTQDSENCTEKGRYSIFDFRNGVFAVTIKDLKKSDSGTYWCGVDRVGFHIAVNTISVMTVAYNISLLFGIYITVQCLGLLILTITHCYM